MSLFYGQLSDKPLLACKTHMGASEANRKPRGCADRAASVTRAAEGRAKGSCVGPGSTESGEIPYYYLALPSYP